ncbi:MAG: response regulator, partial [Deltaproteobacteria bacterium]|nr:response regulator [Deltaproteobacteria bacterium]
MKMKRILIVDDNGTNLYILKCLLEAEGFEVLSAENGKAALEKARSVPPDLIVSDILMPVMDGYTFCRQCKADENLQKVPFVFYTATYTEPKDEKFALSLGADRFVLKPQEPDTLIDILKEVWKQTSAVKPGAARPLGEDMEFFRQYNEILFSKLEKKMIDLEHANQQLKALEEQYRLSFGHVADVIFTIDTDLRFLSVSPSVERILGFKPEEFVGQPATELAKLLTPDS